jgi:SulP family sulfate permease
MLEQDRTTRWRSVLLTGSLIGVTEAAFAVAFAALVFNGPIRYYLAEGIGLYLGASFLTLALIAWRAGKRGVIGGVQATVVALLSIVAATTGVRARGGPYDSFLTVEAATVVVTVLCGIAFLVLGMRRRGDLIRFLPVPVVGGLIAGAGWLLVWGGVHVAIDESSFYAHLDVIYRGGALRHWLPAAAFGVVLLLVVRITRKPLVIPVAIGIGLVGFAVVASALGASVGDVRSGGWVLGAFNTDPAWQPWGPSAVAGVDWLALASSWAPIVITVVIAVIVMLSNLDRIEAELDRGLDTDEELRDAAPANLLSGITGAIPGFHAPGPTSVAARVEVDATRTGLVAAAVPLLVLLSGAMFLELLPRMIVGGLLVFLGLSLISEWVWDRRRSFSRIEYGVVLMILAVVVAKGYSAGFVVGLVLSVVMFAISYGRVDLVHEVAFGEVYRSSVDRSSMERARLRALADSVQILRVSGYVFFGSSDRLLERIRARLDPENVPSFLLLDLTRVTGVDSSAVAALTKAERLATAHDFEIVITGASETARTRMERGGVLGTEGRVRFERDLDRGLQRCEDALLADPANEGGETTGPDGPPAGIAPFLEQMAVVEGAVLLHQDDPPGDVYILVEGRLAVETLTAEGKRVRLGTLSPGVVVGEIAFYTGVHRTADVVAETPCVLLRCSREQIARMEGEAPEVAVQLHRWLTGTMAHRLSDTIRSFDALLD